MGGEPRDDATEDVAFDDTIASLHDISGQVARQSGPIPTAPTAAPACGPGEDSRHATTTVATPVDALRGEELVRTRMFVRIALVIVTGAAVAVWIAGGDPIARIVVAIGCGVVALTGVWFLATTRAPENFTVRRLTIGAAMGALGTFGGTYYWGVASPACAIFVYGIYFYSTGGHARSTLFLYLWCASLQLVLSAATIGGWLEERSLLRSTDMTLVKQVMTQAVIQFLFLAAYVTGRRSRLTLLEAVERHENAVRVVSQREAVLAEARAELERALRPGGPGRYTEQVVGSFRLGILIGRGGMGEVYEATRVTDGAPAAVKLLHTGALADPEQVRRFLRETQTSARLACEHVVTVLEVGTTTGEIPFLAMELLRGVDLAHDLRRYHTLPVADVVTLVRQVGIGLSAARKAGIVHRDIKPHNLFRAQVGDRHVWKILDFGVSKIGPTGTLTRGRVVGTPAYMAPEQARGDDVDWRADVYALAAIAYRCFTGHPPYTGKDVPSTLYNVVFRMPTRPSLLADMPLDIERVLAIGLAKRPEDRFQDGAEIGDALEAAAADGLAPELRARADAVIEAAPWGRQRDA